MRGLWGSGLIQSTSPLSSSRESCSQVAQLGGASHFLQYQPVLPLERIQCFTILWQQPGIQALQVLSPADGKWVDAPAIEGALVIKWVTPHPLRAHLANRMACSLGDQFMRWTSTFLLAHFEARTEDGDLRANVDGIFQSNVHRAINTSGAERYSIPLFFGTDYDVLLEVRFLFFPISFFILLKLTSSFDVDNDRCLCSLYRAACRGRDRRSTR